MREEKTSTQGHEQQTERGGTKWSRSNNHMAESGGQPNNAEAGETCTGGVAQNKKTDKKNTVRAFSDSWQKRKQQKMTRNGSKLQAPHANTKRG